MSKVKGITPLRPRCWTVADQSGMVFYSGHYDHVFMEHAHDDLTFVYITRGAVAVSIEGMERILAPGQLAVIAPQQIHAARPAARGGWCMRSVQIAAEALPGEWKLDNPSIGLTESFRESNDRLTRWFLEFHQTAEDLFSENGDDWESDSNLLDMVEAELSRFQFSQHRKAEDRTISEVQALLIEQTFDNIPLQDLATQFRMSEVSLIKRFRNRFGISPHRWRLQQRANEVSHMLRVGHCLADAAAMCGFSDQAHMTRTFKRVFGVTPGNFSDAFGI